MDETEPVIDAEYRVISEERRTASGRRVEQNEPGTTAADIQRQREAYGSRGVLRWLARLVRHNEGEKNPVLQASKERGEHISEELRQHLKEGGRQLRRGSKLAQQEASNPALTSIRREAERADARAPQRRAELDDRDRRLRDREPPPVADGGEALLEELRRELVAERRR